MQASKITVGNIYAVKRGNGYVRLHVTAIVTRKDSRKTYNTVEGFIVEDRKEDVAPVPVKKEPADIEGPFEQVMELVERKKAEDEKRAQEQAASHEEALRKRALLYEFVGQPVPKKSDEYKQLFRATGYYRSSVDVSTEGVDAIVARLDEMKAQNIAIRPVHLAEVDNA